MPICSDASSGSVPMWKPTTSPASSHGRPHRVPRRRLPVVAGLRRPHREEHGPEPEAGGAVDLGHRVAHVEERDRGRAHVAGRHRLELGEPVVDRRAPGAQQDGVLDGGRPDPERRVDRPRAQIPSWSRSTRRRCGSLAPGARSPTVRRNSSVIRPPTTRRRKTRPSMWSVSHRPSGSRSLRGMRAASAGGSAREEVVRLDDVRVARVGPDLGGRAGRDGRPLVDRGHDAAPIGRKRGTDIRSFTCSHTTSTRSPIRERRRRRSRRCSRSCGTRRRCVPSSSTMPDTYGTTGWSMRAKGWRTIVKLKTVAVPGQVDPFEAPLLAHEADRARAGAGTCRRSCSAARSAGPPVPRPRRAGSGRRRGGSSGRSGTRPGRPVPERPSASCAVGRVGHGVRHLRSRVPLTGRAAGPPVTSANSAPSTWFTATPRSCSTASRMWVMPMM